MDSTYAQLEDLNEIDPDLQAGLRDAIRDFAAVFPDIFWDFMHAGHNLSQDEEALRAIVHSLQNGDPNPHETLECPYEELYNSVGWQRAGLASGTSGEGESANAWLMAELGERPWLELVGAAIQQFPVSARKVHESSKLNPGDSQFLDALLWWAFDRKMWNEVESTFRPKSSRRSACQDSPGPLRLTVQRLFGLRGLPAPAGFASVGWGDNRPKRDSANAADGEEPLPGRDELEGVRQRLLGDEADAGGG